MAKGPQVRAVVHRIPQVWEGQIRATTEDRRVVPPIEKLMEGQLEAPKSDRGILRRVGVGKWWRSRELTLAPPRWSAVRLV